jgi:ABC-type phosphate transport system substrate-binding protein
MKSNQSSNCAYCGYDANSETATHCEICGQPLSSSIKNQPLSSSSKELSQQVSSKPRSSIRWIASLAVLMLLGGGLYVLWKTHAGSSSPSQSASQPKLATGLQLYDSMQDVHNVPNGLFNYGGGIMFAALATHGMNDAIAKAHPGFQLRYTDPVNSKPGSGTGIAMLIDKQLSFSQSGRPLKEAELGKASSRSFRLEEVPVALDGIAFYTHPGLSLKGLSIEQIQDIFTDKISNWKEVGGPDLPIVPVSIDTKTTSSFQILFEGKENIRPGVNVHILRDYTACIRTVASTPGAISYGSSPLIISQRSVRPVALSKSNIKKYVLPVTAANQINAEAFRDGTYPLTRRLFVVIRRDGSIDEQAGVAYSNFLLSKEGQQIIEKAGFVPLRL